jgi:hypothetical protein
MENFILGIKNFFNFNSSQKENKKILNLTPLENSIIECKKTRDKIKQYIKTLEKEVLKVKAKSIKYLKKNNKERAKFELKRKKMYEMQISNSEKQLEIIIEKIIEIEKTQIESEVLKTLNQSNEILIKLNEEVSVDKWELINDELGQIKMEQDEVKNFFNNNHLNYNDDSYFDLEIENILKEESENNNKEINENNIQNYSDNNNKIFPEVYKGNLFNDSNQRNEIKSKKLIIE